MAGRASGERTTKNEARQELRERELELFDLFFRLTVQAGDMRRTESSTKQFNRRTVNVRQYCGGVPLPGQPSTVAHLGYSMKVEEIYSEKPDLWSKATNNAPYATEHRVQPWLELRNIMPDTSAITPNKRYGPESLWSVEPFLKIERPTVVVNRDEGHISRDALLRIARDRHGLERAQDQQDRWAGNLAAMAAVLDAFAPFDEIALTPGLIPGTYPLRGRADF